MTKKVKSLAPLAFPLTGSHLIEASAGTGKTFTIAMLYVRLVLGHEGKHAFSGGPLTPPEILVVTFTEAATKELRDRIRARLAEAARYFRADPAGIQAPKSDTPDLLHDLRASYAPAEWPLCARRLELAAEWMDEAAVSTIHSWCNRMLREHAFDSQSLFTQKLETDQTELRSEAVRDYWRIFYYPLSLEQSAQVKACWDSPADLEEAVKNLLDHADRLPDASHLPSAIIDICAAEKRRRLEELKRPWCDWVDQLYRLFAEAEKAGKINRRKLRVDYYGKWLDTLKAWAEDPAAETLEINKGWERLTPEGIAEVWTEGPVPAHPAFQAIADLRDALNHLPQPGTDLLTHAVRWIARRFAAAQKQRAEIGFNDLLTGLETALGGPHGQRLADTIRRQFPVALIDEFQDTDPIQYRIFERVYEISRNRQDCALILIGDPKQAIYAFRGADIHTYLKARAAVGDRLSTLDTNFRSTQAMVDAVNHCFARAEQRESGAFLFKKGRDNPVPFHALKANGRKESFRVKGKTCPAMVLAALSTDGPVSKSAYIAQMSDICATQIVEWLNRGTAGEAGFAGEKGAFEALRPGDIAILVNNGSEAACIRQALALRGVRSVYLSDKETVFATRQALEVHRWLAACAEPDNDRLLRAALSTESLGLSFAELDALNGDEEALEARVVQFKGYREMWQKQGVLPMLRRILLDFDCTNRLLNHGHGSLNGQSGERVVTDILHLAEILQQASFTIEGEHALIRFLAEQIAAPEGESEGKKLRLESDADLVKVVTIHKSKGLEYPLVFLPFISATRLTKNSDVPLKWHDDQGELRVSLEPDPEAMRRAEIDRLGEDLRKLYVALTRARFLTWLGLAPIEKNAPTAIGHVLGVEGDDAEQYLQAVKTLAKGLPCMHAPASLTPKPDRFAPPRPPARAPQACRPLRAPKEDWWISSYSSLQIQGRRHVLPASLDDTPETENFLEGQRELETPALPTRQDGAPIHRFFKGSEAGIFLHDLMEWAAQAGFQAVLADPAALRDTIARRCRIRGWEAWIDPLVDWVRQMLTTPLPVGATEIRLDRVSVAKAEMEFWFEASRVDLQRLDALVTRHTLAGRPRPPLAPDSLNGMLKGFVDLVFAHDGRYYVADYKSNWLGAKDEDYTAAAMDEAIRSHRYDLQYVIYLFALHRLLKSRLREYDYDAHLGGAAYLFLRGVGAGTAGVHFERPPKALMDALDSLFTGAA